MDGFDGKVEARIGRIVSVSGGQLVMLIDQNLQLDSADDVSALQIGTLVKTQSPTATVYGIVTGLSIPIPSADNTESEMRVVELTLLGETPYDKEGERRPFRRGVSRTPTLDDAVYATTKADLGHVYARPSSSSICVGTIHQDRTMPAHIMTDELLGKHFAILGTTGSGKSCAATLILQGVIEQNPNAHIVVLDPHNEYARALGEAAEVLDPTNLELPYWLLTLEELMEILFGPGLRIGSEEANVLGDLIAESKRKFAGEGTDTGHITLDTPVPYRMSALLRQINDDMGRLDNASLIGAYRHIRARLTALQNDPRFAFMFGGISVRDRMAAILGQIFRIPVEGKPITIVDLSGVPSEILNVVVSVICRLTFDFALWSERAVPMLLVCEEAHRYAPHVAKEGLQLTMRALSRIAKEGRKYGVSLCVISQRPSRLDTDLLSQCNTIFGMRMSNNEDQEYLRGAMNESSLGLLSFLPSLRNSEAVTVGQGVSVPARIRFASLPEDRRPHSGMASFSESWQQDVDSAGFLQEVVQRWRHQKR